MIQKTIYVLLVEDNPGDARLIQHIANEGIHRGMFQFTHVERIQEALQQLDEKHFDVVVLDLSLPDSHGLNTIRRIHSKCEKTPIVVLTVVKDETTGWKSVREGAQDFLVKGSINSDLFSRSIHYAIERNRLDRIKDELMNNVSHELKTPLTIMQEGISQLQDGIYGKVTDKQKNCLSMVYKNAERLTELIDDLLDMSRLEEGHIELSRDHFDLITLTQGVCEEFSPFFIKKGLRLEQHYFDQHLEIFADKGKVIQIFNNLLNNALKFTDKGLVEVIVRKKNRHVECSVHDTGRGIAKEDIPKLFNKFVQFDRENGPGKRGTGLGLAISKGLVELHGGEFSIESEIDKGSVFTFTLPIHSAQETLRDYLRETLEFSEKQSLKFTIIELELNDIPSFGNQMKNVFLKEIEKIVLRSLRRKYQLATLWKEKIYVILPERGERRAKEFLKRIMSNLDTLHFQKNLQTSQCIKTTFLYHPQNTEQIEALLQNLNNRKQR